SEGARAKARAGTGELVVWSTRETYRVGDTLQFRVQATVACYPSLIALDAQGQALAIYPNGFEAQRKLQPGQQLKVPDSGSEYFLRANTAGRERVLAFCSDQPGPVFANEVDYIRQVFPILGDWTEFQKAAGERFQNALTSEQLAAARRRRERAVRRWSRRRRSRRGRKPAEIVDKRPRPLLRAAAGYLVRAK
ncbi:MAG: DUF4384 domain-containing protein, partial [Pseudomonadota bacterium]